MTPAPAPGRSDLGQVDTKNPGAAVAAPGIKGEHSECRADFVGAQAAMLWKVSPQCAIPSIAPQRLAPLK